ncbi:MAG: [protein-PII] uridylyltransferase [Acidimicrobiales bacterium]
MSSLTAARAGVLEDRTLQGTELCRALSGAVDGWLMGLYNDSIGAHPSVALVAVGGYGRAELAPHSDLDVLLVHNLDPDAADVAGMAGALWYPIWDEGAKLGHSVRTVREALELARTDLDTATSLLSVRHLAGDEKLSTKLASAARSTWRRHARTWLPRLGESAALRHERAGEVAFMLEPALKEGRGGLRDVHALRWAALAERGQGSLEETGLLESHEVILRARVELHRETGRSGNVLLLEQQDAVAAALGYVDADVMMAEVAASARVIAWHTDEVLNQLLDGLRRRVLWLQRRRGMSAGHGITVTRDRVHLEHSADVTAETVLRLAVAAAQRETRFAPATIERLQSVSLDVPEPWPDELRDLFVDLLSEGHAAIPVIETLDQLGLFVPYVPEWAPTRPRPQRNAYHRFTVDRHLWETAAEAARLAPEVARPDLLMVGSLLHDIGKGYPGDHTEVGMELIAVIGERMGFAAAGTALLVSMCRHHLLLPDVATRRDLDDDDTVAGIVDAVGSTELLHLLHALTEADSIATGPAAWSTWKAGLVRDLTNRVAFVLEGGDAGELPRNFPTEEHLREMRRGTTGISSEGNVLTILAVDHQGIFSRAAGAIAINGLEVLEAAAHAEFGIALAMFRVQSSFDDEIDWDRVCASAQEAVNGRLALAARIDERIRTYARRGLARAPQRLVETQVTIDNDSSSSATVIEVAAPNSIGLLYYVTRALGRLDLDIGSAKVQTLGHDVVDSFYVRDRRGAKIDDPQYLAEIERALHHAVRVASRPLENRHD